MNAISFPDRRGVYELFEELSDGLAEIKRMLEKQPLGEPASGWLNVKRAATYIDLSEEALRALVKRGQIEPHRTPTGGLRFRPGDLDAWVRRGAA